MVRARLIAVAFLALRCAADAADVRVSGPEVMALQTATTEFLRQGYSTSGDLRHYIVSLTARGEQVEVTFVPKQVPGRSVRGGQTEHGREVHFFVSLKTQKIVRHEFAR